MRIKKIVSLAMAAVMTASALTGCGSSETGSGGSASQGSGQSAGKGGEKTVINIWSKDRHDANYVQKKVDEYNQNNTDNVEVVYTLYTDNYKCRTAN